ncbi:HIT family protein [Shouchella miscanthi]|uniref:HIT domain-containing protein n=1 Tax=Shouchella miscanthi TaxID=2598861 RepID=A0ABU6NPQ0_9BACI|nr:HIT domain-containing protein [Shouchella miscanthi]MED4130173.1 HIT domain-containing protein [Shouchella miscanthi]
MLENLMSDFCSFCEQDENKIVYKTKNYTVWLSVGQIVEGYCLIIPNDHYHCIGSIPNELREEFYSVKEYTRSFLQELYGSCIFYEHGRVGACNVQPGEQLCYHGHLHAVPIQSDLMPLFVEDGLFPITLKNENEMFEVYRKIGHYLFYENNQGEGFMFHINQPIRRQYLRHLAAKSIGNEKLADWNDYPEWEKLYAAKERILTHTYAR